MILQWLTLKKTKVVAWTPSEDMLLEQIVRDAGEKRSWSRISKRLFYEFGRELMLYRGAK